MNERIQELAEEAGMRHPVMGEVSYAMFDYEKFAELIIQEYARVNKRLTDEQIDNAIRKHADDLLDYICENGTICEGVTVRIRALARAAIDEARVETK